MLATNTITYLIKMCVFTFNTQDIMKCPNTLAQLTINDGSGVDFNVILLCVVGEGVQPNNNTNFVPEKWNFYHFSCMPQTH